MALEASRFNNLGYNLPQSMSLLQSKEVSSPSAELLETRKAPAVMNG